MINYTDIKGSAIAQLKTFSFSPIVSIPTDSHVGDVIQAAKTVWAIATSDKAKKLYSDCWKAIKWAAATVWTISLVTLGLVLLAIEAWQKKEQIEVQVADFVCDRVTDAAIAVVEISAAVISAGQSTRDFTRHCRAIGRCEVQNRIVDRAREYQLRSKVAIHALTNGIDL